MNVTQLLQTSDALVGSEICVEGYLAADATLRKALLYEKRHNPILPVHPCVRLVSDELFDSLGRSDVVSSIKLVPGGSFDVRGNVCVRGTVSINEGKEICLTNLSHVVVTKYDRCLILVGKQNDHGATKAKTAEEI